MAAARLGARHGEESGVAEAADIEAEFQRFVTTRSTALLRTAYLLAGDWATAEDLLQISLTKTYLAWKRLGHIEAVESYARRVLVNTSTSWWRRRWHRERPTENMPETPAPDRVHEHVERDALWRHVRTLPPRQRAVLVLRYYEDMSEADTAKLLGVTAGTVKSQASRALATLRDRLGAAEAVEAAALGHIPAARRPPPPAPDGAAAADGPLVADHAAAADGRLLADHAAVADGRLLADHAAVADGRPPVDGAGGQDSVRAATTADATAIGGDGAGTADNGTERLDGAASPVSGVVTRLEGGTVDA